MLLRNRALPFLGGLGDHPGHFAEVLGGGGEEELVFCAIWSPEAQAIDLQDALGSFSTESTPCGH